jgi:protease I
MPQDTLKGLRVAILATDGFEQSELLEPRKALREACADIIARRRTQPGQSAHAA